jgi:cytochrome P450
MMVSSPILQAVFLLPVIYLLQRWFRGYLAERRFQRFARDNDCQPPHLSINQLPWGIDRIIQAFRSKGDILDGLIFARYKREGTWTYTHTTLFGQHMLHTAEPRNLQAILATRFKDFEIGETRHRQFGPLLGYGILTSDGPAWEHFRALLKPQFSREQISDLNVAERHVQHLFQALHVKDDGWTEGGDILELFYRLTLDIITEFLVGRSVNLQLAALDKVASEGGTAPTDATQASAEAYFRDGFAISQETLMWRIRLQGLYWLMDSKAFRRACAMCHRFIDGYVATALNSTRVGAEKDARVTDAAKEKYVLLDKLVESTQDPIELRDQLLQLLIAGRDTTATTLAFVFGILARQPEAWTKLRAEVLQIFGAEGQGEEITFAKLKSARYVQYVINETLRLYPVIPLNNRIAVRDSVLPVGGGPDGKAPIAVRKGTLVMFSDYIMHRREDIWGEDVLEWKPERWVDRKQGWEYLPFNGGPRTCIGRESSYHVSTLWKPRR